MKVAGIFCMILFPSLLGFAQMNYPPDAGLRDLDGKVVSIRDIFGTGEPVLMVFWKTGSHKCFENLDLMNDSWEEVLRDRGVRLVAVCIDCNGSWCQVRPIVNGRNWEFENYVDVNGDFKRSMCVGEGPCNLLFDGEMHLLCRYNSGCSGSEDFVCGNILGHLNNDVKELSMY